MDKKYMQWLMLSVFVLILPLCGMDQIDKGHYFDVQQYKKECKGRGHELILKPIEKTTFDYRKHVMYSQEKVKVLWQLAKGCANHTLDKHCTIENLLELKEDLVLGIMEIIQGIDESLNKFLPLTTGYLQYLFESATDQSSIDSINSSMQDVVRLQEELSDIHDMAENLLSDICLIVENVKKIQAIECIPLRQQLLAENLFAMRSPMQSQAIILAPQPINFLSIRSKEGLMSSPSSPLATAVESITKTEDGLSSEPVENAVNQLDCIDQLYRQGPPAYEPPMPPLAHNTVDTSLRTEPVIKEGAVPGDNGQEPVVSEVHRINPGDQQIQKDLVRRALRNDKQKVVQQYNKIMRYGCAVVGGVVFAVSAFLLYKFFYNRSMIVPAANVSDGLVSMVVSPRIMAPLSSPIRCFLFSLIVEWRKKL